VTTPSQNGRAISLEEGLHSGKEGALLHHLQGMEKGPSSSSKVAISEKNAPVKKWKGLLQYEEVDPEPPGLPGE